LAVAVAIVAGIGALAVEVAGRGCAQPPESGSAVIHNAKLLSAPATNEANRYGRS
jgi:hypothetical protein